MFHNAAAGDAGETVLIQLAQGGTVLCAARDYLSSNTGGSTYLTLTLNHIVTLTASNAYTLQTSSTSTSGSLSVMPTENSLAIEAFP